MPWALLLTRAQNLHPLKSHAQFKKATCAKPSDGGPQRKLQACGDKIPQTPNTILIPSPLTSRPDTPPAPNKNTSKDYPTAEFQCWPQPPPAYASHSP